ncbi:ABC transporter ATP-binding protein [Desulfocicer niacini]
MITLDNLSFIYPGKTAPALEQVHLQINRGEFVLICGPTGCGKTTLLKVLTGIIPHESEGIMTGNALIDSLDTRATPLATLSRTLGLVQQNPDDQIFSLVVEDEVAFGPENLNLEVETIGLRVDRALEQVGLAGFRGKSVQELSGGQKQRVAIAGMLAMEPGVLLLDEPVSQLDPLGAGEVLSVIAGINSDKKTTIILVEHRIHEVAHLVDRIIVMDKGKILINADKNEVFENHIPVFEQLGLRLPEMIEIFHLLDLGRAPLTEKLGLDLLKKRLNGFKGPDGHRGLGITGFQRKEPQKKNKIPVLKMENLWFAYGDKNWVLKGVDLELYQGEVIGLLGSNGSGKSTLLLHMGGLLRPQKGDVRVLGKNTRTVKPESMAGDVAVVFQDPGLMLFCDSVYKEVDFGPRNLKLGERKIRRQVDDALKAMSIEDLIAEPPQALSGGQRLRAAVASMLSLKPKILLLDEPTSGQDKRNILTFMRYIKSLSDNLITCVFITHDMETALKFADRIIVLNHGKLIANESPATVFEDTALLEKACLKPPQALRFSRELGLGPAFCAIDLANIIKTVAPHV